MSLGIRDTGSVSCHPKDVEKVLGSAEMTPVHDGTVATANRLNLTLDSLSLDTVKTHLGETMNRSKSGGSLGETASAGCEVGLGMCDGPEVTMKMENKRCHC